MIRGQQGHPDRAIAGPQRQSSELIQMSRLNAYGRAFWTGAAVLMAISAPTSVFGDWWIVRSADEKCLVVDVEPNPGDEGVTKIGKENYQSAEEAEADLKRICGESD